MSGHLLCFGYGYTAKAVAPLLLAKGWKITGTSHDACKLKEFEEEGVSGIHLTGNPLEAEALKDVTDILISTKPNETGCPALETLRPAMLKLKTLNRLIYLSSTGVYGDQQGNWIDETTPTTPTEPRGIKRLQAEQDWATLALETNTPLAILRLAGIYGPGRNALLTLKRRYNENDPTLAQRIIKQGQYFNRIHVADIAMLLQQVLNTDPENITLNVSDNEPSPPQDVIEYAAQLLGLPVPPSVTLDEAKLSPMGRSFYADSKRLNNKKLLDYLETRLQFPTYKQGLNALLKE